MRNRKPGHSVATGSSVSFCIAANGARLFVLGEVRVLWMGERKWYEAMVVAYSTVRLERRLRPCGNGQHVTAPMRVHAVSVPVIFVQHWWV